MKAHHIFIPLSFILSIVAYKGVAQGDNPGTLISSIGKSVEMNCTDPLATIGVRINPWVEGFTYSWNTGETDSVIYVRPATTTTYVLQITNTALGISMLKGFHVAIVNDPIQVNTSDYSIDKFTCPGTELSVTPNFVGGYGPYTYIWPSGGTTESELLYPESSQQLQVTITDVCGTEAVAEINVNVEKHDDLIAPANQTIEFNCEADLISVEPKLSSVSGGVGYGYKYTFNDWQEVSKPANVEADEELVLHALITDECGIQTATVDYSFEKSELIVPTADGLEACDGQTVSITDDSENQFYYWDGSSMNPKAEITVEKSSIVNLTYLDRCGDKHNVPRQIELIEVEADFEYDVHAYESLVELYALASGDDESFVWSIDGQEVGSGTQLQAPLQNGQESSIELTVKNKNGCIASETKTVIARDNYSVPSAFSPNGDGNNDLFQMEFDEEFENFSIQIFDRWGQLIYQSSDQYFTWKGEESGSGLIDMYVYTISGKTLSGEQIKKTGTLTVVN